MKPRYFALGLNPLKPSVRMWVPKEDTGKKHGYVVWGWWWHWLNPVTYWRWLKRLCQRGYYGYAGCDHWSADAYLEEVMLGVFRDLRKYAHGYPASLARYGPFDEWHEGEPVEDGFERWIAILDEIIEGLEASHELSAEETVPDGVYSKGPIVLEPDEDNPMLLKMVDKSGHQFNRELYEEWQAPLLKKRKRAMLLICKYWGSFWD